MLPVNRLAATTVIDVRAAGRGNSGTGSLAAALAVAGRADDTAGGADVGEGVLNAGSDRSAGGSTTVTGSRPGSAADASSSVDDALVATGGSEEGAGAVTAGGDAADLAGTEGVTVAGRLAVAIAPRAVGPNDFHGDSPSAEFGGVRLSSAGSGAAGNCGT